MARVAGDRPIKEGTILNNLQKLTPPKFIEILLMLVSHMFGAKICVLTPHFIWVSHPIGEWSLHELDRFPIMILCERSKMFGVDKQPTASPRELPKVEGVGDIEEYLRLERNRRVDARLFGQTGHRLPKTKSRSMVEQVVAYTMLNLPTMMRNAATAAAAAATTTTAAAATATAPNPNYSERYEALQESLMSQMGWPGPSTSSSTSTTQPIYHDPTRAAVPHGMKPITVAPIESISEYQRMLDNVSPLRASPFQPQVQSVVGGATDVDFVEAQEMQPMKVEGQVAESEEQVHDDFTGQRNEADEAQGQVASEGGAQRGDGNVGEGGGDDGGESEGQSGAGNEGDDGGDRREQEVIS